MKKICVALALLCAAITAGAQTMYDAINFSQTNLAGTARSMAVGNAMTAVGGDLGAIVLNPAGSAVFNYSTVAFTPGLTISAVSSQYSNYGETAYGPTDSNGNTRFTMPNVGFVTHFNTGQSSGLKGWSFSFLSTQTNNFQSFFTASGINSLTSLAAERGASSAGFSEYTLSQYDSFNNSDISWDLLAGYQGGLTGSVKEGYYVGNNELVVEDEIGIYDYVPGQLRQTANVRKYGSKNDIIFNGALNFNDRLYVGFTMGVPIARYRYSEGFTEAAVDPGQFPVDFYKTKREIVTTWFSHNYTDYSYAANIDGIYGKIGLIVLPVKGLRLGVAFQTPTALTISETWAYSASSHYEDSNFNGSVSSPTGEYTYCLRTPYTVDAGIAYTFGPYGFISVDYELMDYSVMKFSMRHDSGYGAMDDYFPELNSANKNFCGLSHTIRVGAEVKVTPQLALRAGYNLITNPECHWTNNNGQNVTCDDYMADYDSYRSGKLSLVNKMNYKENISALSFGLGYSSPGSFFVDLAAKRTSYPASVYAPYYDYYGFTPDGESFEEFLAPRVKSTRNLWNVSLTFGWRF